MELIIFIAALVLLDLLAMRFGVDSRALDARCERGWWSQPLIGDLQRDFFTSHQHQLRYEAEVERVVSLAGVRRPNLALRTVRALRGCRQNWRRPSQAAARAHAVEPVRPVDGAHAGMVG